jgi:N-acetylglucosaminyl-diphospho-decaprenol L-rhamnosyltransferase
VRDDALRSITVVIASWGTPEHTLRSAGAVIADGVPAERVVVVDDGSQDDSADRLARELPDCVLVRLPQNVGYASAANAGVAALPGTSYLILNNDAFVHRPGSVAAMVNAMSDERVAIVVPRLLNPDLSLQPSVRPVDTPLVALVRASGLSRFIPNRHQPSWSTHWDHAASREIHVADGAVLLVRRDAWEELSGFSPRAYLYAEDTDICWRAERLGRTVWFESGAEFIHIGNATAGQRWSDPERAERVSRSEARLLRERLPPVRASLSILFTAAGLLARGAAFALRGEPERSDAARAQLRGYLSALRPSRPSDRGRLSTPRRP